MQAREHRQTTVLDWTRRAFGHNVANDPIERARRFIEEAVELAQACGLSKTEARAIVDHVFGKPAGEIGQEVGGVGVTLLALCELHGISADRAEAEELGRVLRLPISHFRKRQNAKADAGVALHSSLEAAQ